MLGSMLVTTPRTRFGVESLRMQGLRQRLRLLDEAQRIVVVLFYLEGLSLEEIGAILDKSEDEVAAVFYLSHVALGTAPALPPVGDPE